METPRPAAAGIQAVTRAARGRPWVWRVTVQFPATGTPAAELFTAWLADLDPDLQPSHAVWEFITVRLHR